MVPFHSCLRVQEPPEEALTTTPQSREGTVDPPEGMAAVWGNPLSSHPRASEGSFPSVFSPAVTSPACLP